MPIVRAYRLRQALCMFDENRLQLFLSKETNGFIAAAAYGRTIAVAAKQDLLAAIRSSASHQAQRPESAFQWPFFARQSAAASAIEHGAGCALVCSSAFEVQLEGDGAVRALPERGGRFKAAVDVRELGFDGGCLPRTLAVKVAAETACGAIFRAQELG